MARNRRKELTAYENGWIKNIAKKKNWEEDVNPLLFN